MKTIPLYLQQVKSTPHHIVFTDGENTMKIPHSEIVNRKRIIKRDYEVTITHRFAKEEGII